MSRRSRPIWFERVFGGFGITPVTWEGFVLLLTCIGAFFGTSQIGAALARLGVAPDLRHLAATVLGLVGVTCLILMFVFTGPRRY